ncbi:benzoate 4-monooxygenase cytochrome P450 [Sclerotinia borealis F-4128]|uniref:Benzoate 4-monooxygenase cytochrome P450 n=1 Tax=Sclerotinia borealis (strain F-4128) TaxID=1432307 RepID=W9CUY1_SCLBF|nr:benzoate 4-monooxygenase cytochrome P450 [Sclerotinia borealis F-4128]
MAPFFDSNSAILISFFCCLIISKIAWEFLFSPLRHFPGPVTAKFTNFHRAFEAYSGHIDKQNIDSHRKYGIAVRIGPNTISFSDPSLIGTIYTTKNAWLKSDMYRPNDVLLQGKRMSNFFNTADTSWHDKYMKPVRGLWTMTKVLEVETLIDETLERLIEKLSTSFADVSKTCMMDDWLAYFAWDVTANVNFGRPFGFIDQEKDVDDLIGDSTRGLYYFAPVSQIPWIDNFLDKNPIIRIGPKPTLTGVIYTFKVVAQYQQELLSPGHKSKPVNHFLNKYLKLKETNPDLVDDSQIVNYLMLSILAGGDTTSSIMRAVVYYLSKSPSAYTKLTDELYNANLSLPAQWKDIRDLPYLNAVLRESIRMNPGIAMILERVVPESGFTLPDGRYIPGGTNVGINPAVTNHDQNVFGIDADSFNPDRWLKEEGESQQAFDARYKHMASIVDFTFGGGSRVCMGKHLAQLELWKLFATLYSIFDIKLTDPEHTWKYHDAWFVYQWDIPMIVYRRARSRTSTT